VSVLAERLTGDGEDFFFRQQEQRGNYFWVFALPAHAVDGGKDFIAPFDGEFSGQRAKPVSQFRLVRDGLDQYRQGVEGGAGVCCHVSNARRRFKVVPKAVCCQRLWREFFRDEFS
jgi:hypothetical protein